MCLGMHTCMGSGYALSSVSSQQILGVPGQCQMTSCGCSLAAIACQLDHEKLTASAWVHADQSLDRTS